MSAQHEFLMKCAVGIAVFIGVLYMAAREDRILSQQAQSDTCITTSRGAIVCGPLAYK
jgi:hypothetical protein